MQVYSYESNSVGTRDQIGHMCFDTFQWVLELHVFTNSFFSSIFINLPLSTKIVENSGDIAKPFCYPSMLESNAFC